MCQFCVQHGDGKAWYLQAETYACDLESDLKRRDYLIDFVKDFAHNREATLKNLDRLDKAPARMRDVGRALTTRILKPSHFGQPVPIEECEAILDITSSVVRIPCVCRTEAGTRDEGYCLAITTKPIDSALEEAFAGYEAGPDTSKFDNLTKDEALALLRRSEEEGCMHSVWTFISPFVAAICNCNLASGCMAMNLTLTHETQAMFKGHYLAEVDTEACTGCRDCVARCPFLAIAIDPGSKRAVVDQEKCYGCGTCRSACRYGALRLFEREPAPAGLLVTGAATA